METDFIFFFFTKVNKKTIAIMEILSIVHGQIRSCFVFLNTTDVLKLAKIAISKLEPCRKSQLYHLLKLNGELTLKILLAWIVKGIHVTRVWKRTIILLFVTVRPTTIVSTIKVSIRKIKFMIIQYLLGKPSQQIIEYLHLFIIVNRVHVQKLVTRNLKGKRKSKYHSWMEVRI